jgi:hypothetical protein
MPKHLSGGSKKKHVAVLGIAKPIARPRRAAAMAAEAKWLPYLSGATGHSFSAVGRSVAPLAGHPTGVAQPINKQAFKSGTYRIRWKGRRLASGRTSGNVPYIGTRDSRKWSEHHNAVRKRLDVQLGAVPGFQNPFGTHFAENSHLQAGSLFGTNDTLSAPPASIHQNTEALAIETGIKSLRKRGNAALGGELRMKVTGYVHESGPSEGMLKAARHKVYIGGRKVLDHASFGERGNIDKDEARHLDKRVRGLTFKSPGARLFAASVPHGAPGAAPSEADARAGQRSRQSHLHPQFTDLRTSKGATLTGVKARDFASGHYKK